MEQTVKICNPGNLEASLQSLSSYSLVVMMAGSNIFKSCVEKVKNILPNTPNIEVCGQGYVGTRDCPDSIILIGFQGCEVAVDAIADAGKPILSLSKLAEHVKNIRGNGKNTVCLDFATANDSVIITTLNSCLSEADIPLIGGTAADNLVGCNGTVYEGGCVYALIKNKNGSIYAHKENIYTPDAGMPNFIATKIDEDSQKIITLNDCSAASVYENALGIEDKDVETQTFKNPLGRLVGDEIYILSVKCRCPDGSLECFKRANPMDSLTILQLADYKAVIQDTVHTIKKELPRVKGVFSFNCIFRYLMFQDFKYWDEYLKTMDSLGTHVGMVGYGEHYKTQHINQTMTCFAFD